MGADDEGERLAGLVAGPASPLGRPLGDRCCLARRLCNREIELEVNIELQRPGQLECPLKQRGGRSMVVPPEGAAAGGGEMLARPLGDSRGGLSELGLVAGCLLQVEAEDLVQPDDVGTFLVEPGGEALVQLGSSRLGQRVVRHFSDHQVAEAEGVFRGNLCPVWPDQTLADERGEARRHAKAVGERLDRSTVEDLPLDRTSLQHGALLALELVKSRGEQRLQGRWVLFRGGLRRSEAVRNKEPSQLHPRAWPTLVTVRRCDLTRI